MSGVLQLIDENKQFNEKVGHYFDELGISRNGNNYHVTSVFGSQSTGKSTLLNALFGTKFGVMNEQSRGQTTKGIWMGESGSKEDPLLILDVEGTDGRERGEDQDFERKAALFALATSEVLIVNMWENQVGLYQGANMGLLKTVFEVNLTLSQTAGGRPRRSCILFVIRDYMGLTPLANLENTLTEDLEKHWASISKPSEELEGSRIHDYFDVKFTALPHKILQPENFATSVDELRAKFGSYILPEYHRNVPIDGWPMYAEQIWQQIELNKDLDLPTQQTLVARFRCEEIANEAFGKFTEEIEALGLDFSGKVVIPHFGSQLGKLRTEALEHYDSLASRYDKNVYNEKRFELLGKVDGILIVHYQAQLAALHRETIALFKKLFRESTDKFCVKSELARLEAQKYFVNGAKDGVIDPSFYSFSVEEREMANALEQEITSQRHAELKQLTAKLVKKAAKGLDQIQLHFKGSTPDPWLAVRNSVDGAVTTVLEAYTDDGFGLDETPEEAVDVRLDVEALTWRALEARIRELVRPDAVVQTLRDRFEDAFRYTPEGLPIVWTEHDDIDGAALKARETALQLLPHFASAKLEDGSFIAPPLLREEKDDGAADDRLDYTELLTRVQREDIERRFLRTANSMFVDAKRAATSSMTHIPYWVYIVILVLGWGKIMTVLQNPFAVVLLALLGGLVYLTYIFNIPTLSMIEASSERLLFTAKQRLREYLAEDSIKEAPKQKIES